MIGGWTKGKSPTFRRSDGFTLLEVVIAVAILALGLVTLLQTQNGNIALVAESERITRATLLAQQHIIELAMGGLPSIGEEAGDFGDQEGNGELSGYRWTHRIAQTDREKLRRVEVTVSWEPHTPGHSVSLVTLVAECGEGSE